MRVDELIEIVDELNYKIIDRFYKKTGDTGNGNLGLYPRIQLSYVTEIGFFIEMEDVWLWREDEDEREWIDVEDKYEPLKPYLINRINELIKTYKTIKL